MNASSLANLTTDERRALLKRLLAERASADTGEFALTHGQRALWFIQQLAPDTRAYNIALALRFRAPLDLPALGRAVDRLVARHSALRTVFSNVDGQPVQRVLPPTPVLMRVVDLPDATEQELFDAVNAEHQRPFVLETAAFRVSMFRQRDQDVLLLAMHHLVVDAWSLELIFEDLRALYESELMGTPAAVRPATARYADFVAAESTMLAGARGERAWQYWSRALAGELPVLDLASDQSASTTVAGASVPFDMTVEQSEAVHALARTLGTTVYTIVLAVTQVLLSRLAGQADVIIGSPVALRAASEFNDLVGYCVNTVPLRTTINPDDTFTSLLTRGREQIIGAMEHQEYPFSLLVDHLQIRRHSNRNPIFQVLLNVLVSARASTLWRLFASSGKETMKFGTSFVGPYVLPQQDGQFELTVEVIERDGRLSGNFRYQTALYSTERAMEIRDAFVALLTAVVANPAARVADLVIPGREQFEL